MDTIRTTIFGIADDIYTAFQNAGKIFGYLSDGRDLVIISDGPDGPVVILPDHGDEGWPEVRAALPKDVAFLYAANGPLTRVACWSIQRPALDVRTESSLAEKTDLGPRATMVVRGKGERTMVMIRQTREADAMRPSWYAREHGRG